MDERCKQVPEEDLPGSSGYMLRSHGIVGSMKGRGVFSSKKSGRLIATFEPLLLRMFAVSVLIFNTNVLANASP